MKTSKKTTAHRNLFIANFQAFAITTDQQHGVKGGEDGDVEIIVQDVVEG